MSRDIYYTKFQLKTRSSLSTVKYKHNEIVKATGEVSHSYRSNTLFYVAVLGRQLSS